MTTMLFNNNEFDGEWIFNFKLPIISQFHLGFYVSSENIQEEYEEEVTNLKNEMVIVSVDDPIDLNPDPSTEQINTLKYIQANEFALLTKIHLHLINEVLPNCDYLDDSNSQIKSEFNLEILREHLAIATLHIYRNFKENYAYYDLTFYFKGYNDEEWINFLFYKDSIIGFGYEESKSLIEQDSNSKYYELDMSNDKAMDNLSFLLPSNEKYYKPLSKYNKLKPWQAWYNEYQLERIIENSNYEEFEEALDSGQVDPNFHFPYQGMSLINRACVKNKPLFVEYLLKKKVNTKHTILYSNNKELIQLLISYGVDINSYLPWKTTKLADAIKFLCYDINNNSESYNTRLQWVKFLIQNGGDLNNCDTLGRNYVEILNESYSKEEIMEMGIVNIINKLV